MSKPLVIVSAIVAAARIANAQPAADQPQPQPQQQTTPAPPLDPEPDAEPPPLPPPPEVTPYQKCREQRHTISEQANHATDMKERTRLLQSMPECTENMTDAPSPIEAPVVEGESTGPHTGFALEVRLETAQTFIDDDAYLPGTQGGIFIGSRGHSVTIGVGLDLSRLTMAQSTSVPQTVESSRSFTSLLVSPGIRAVLARSGDERTELFGQFDIGYGAMWNSSSDAMVDSPSTHHLRIQAAPGVRYWVSPNFAFGGSAGLRYERYSLDDSSTMTDRSSALTSIFSSLQMTGVF